MEENTVVESACNLHLRPLINFNRSQLLEVHLPCYHYLDYFHLDAERAMQEVFCFIALLRMLS